jgi:hypothetical protein
MLGDIGSKFDRKGFSDEKPEIVPQIPFALGLGPCADFSINLKTGK